MKKTLFFILLFANVFFANANTRMCNYRWRNDDGNETTAAWKAAVDNPIQINNLDPIRIRIAVQEYSGQPTSVNVSTTIEYAENGGPWTNLSAVGSKFIYAPSAILADDTNTTQQISSGSFGGGKFRSANNSGSVSILGSFICEHEFCIRPTAAVSPSATYTFRIIGLNGTGTLTPTLTTAAVLCLTPNVYNVTGGGNSCASSGVEISLDGSQADISYQLKRNGTTIPGAVLIGNGSPLSFGSQTVSGNYTIEAINTVPGCTLTATMNGNAMVNIDPISIGGDVIGGNTICSNTTANVLTLTGNTGNITHWEIAVSPFTVWTTIANTTNVYSPGALTETTQFRAVSKSGICNSATSTETTVTVTNTPAPSGATLQIYAGTAFLTNLIVNGADIKWFTAASNGTELPNTTEVIDGETYYASQTDNGCESSSRLAITVRKISETSQSFCAGATLDDLITTPSTGQTVQWFTDPLDPTPIPAGTPLYTGLFYAVQYTPTSNMVPVNVEVYQYPITDTPVNVTSCGSYMLMALTSGNYFTEPNGQGTALYMGDIITSSQTLYVFAETGTVPNCTAESSFEVTIGNPVADAPVNVTSCYSYILPTLTSGNYFTESNGGGTALFAGDNITASQTIYVYAESGTTPNCTAENSFDVTIASPVADAPFNVTSCYSYALPALTSGNYFTETNGGGTSLFEGNTITTSQTIYVYAESGTTPNCTAENSFEITIIAPVADVPGNIVACDSYTLPALNSGSYFTETNGGGTPLSAGDVISVTQIIYVYTESGTTPNCTAENSFEVFIAPSTSNVANVTVCDSYYFWPADGQYYYASGTYTAPSECHTEILNLTLNPILDTTISLLGDIVTVTETGGSYQWNVCENNGTFTPIVGATNQDYLAATAGSYAVEVTKNGCTVMSNCFEVVALGNDHFDANSNVNVYPNPSKEVFYIDTDSRSTIVVFDWVGKTIRTMEIHPGTSKLDVSNFPTGMYLMKMTNENNQTKTIKLIKE